MANEHVIVERYGANNEGNQIRYTILDGEACSKGTLMCLVDPRTVSAANGASAYWAGVSAVEKVASDGTTSVSVMTQGIFKATASGAITAGQGVAGAESNKIRQVGTFGTTSGAQVIGYAIETFADGEIKQYQLRL